MNYMNLAGAVVENVSIHEKGRENGRNKHEGRTFKTRCLSSNGEALLRLKGEASTACIELGVNQR